HRHGQPCLRHPAVPVPRLRQGRRRQPAVRQLLGRRKDPSALDRQIPTQLGGPSGDGPPSSIPEQGSDKRMRGTLIYIGQRLVLIAITTVLVSSIVFVLLHQIPGNAFLNETRQSPQTLAAELHHYGLDLPLQQQYLN